MSTAIGILIVVGLCVLLLAGPAILRALPRMGAVAAGGRTLGYLVAGLVGGIVLIALVASSTMPWQTWLMLVLAGVVAVVYRTSMPGRVAAGFLLALGLVYGAFHGFYGDKAGEAAEENRKALVRAALSASTPSTGQPAQATASATAASASQPVKAVVPKTVLVKYEFTTLVKNEKSPTIRLQRGSCYFADSEGPNSPPVHVWASEKKDPDPNNDDDWKHLGTDSKAPTRVRVIRVGHTVDHPVRIIVELRPDGQCDD